VGMSRNRGRVVHMGEQARHVARFLIWHTPGQQVVEHACECIDVGARIDLPALDLLRRM